MLISKNYIVRQIDGDYAHLLEEDGDGQETKLVARALLPAEIYEGCRIRYELLQYFMAD